MIGLFWVGERLRPKQGQIRITGSLVHCPQRSAIARSFLPSHRHVLQRLDWLYVHVFLAGSPIPVSDIVLFYSSLPKSRHPTSSQLLENFRRQSVEGLALPFLANWLLGTIYTPLAVHRDAHS